ncbi:hypothetical protein DN524_33445, partial [Burkholderia multivorans]|uniref:sulfite exporter TauE/SafE family protein n=1 Tax=Burkholderia multivorans TaxID=87883 RepID=UPI000DB35F6F
DWRTVLILAVPGFIGAFAGATFLAGLNGDAATPWISGLLLALGIYVIWRFLALGGARPTFKARPGKTLLVPIGLVGGALDAIGGGVRCRPAPGCRDAGMPGCTGRSTT